MRKHYNISTNIIRDSKKEIDYVVTPNTKGLFERIFVNNYSSNRSFNLIGNYGTGKSTFLWAMEKNLKGEKLFFSPIEKIQDQLEFKFIQLVGEKVSLLESLGKKLRIKDDPDNEKVLASLERRRVRAENQGKGLVLVIDEFGKFLEYSASSNSSEDLYLLQRIAEWANDDSSNVYFLITLHQNFNSYSNKLSPEDRLEWEKVKGRFVDLLFNEPVEQLIYFASEKLKCFDFPKSLEQRLEELNQLILDSKLISFSQINRELNRSLYPLDWLSANILVHSLQRYGQNERSLFSFLNDSSSSSINNHKFEFYTVSDVYNYLVKTLTTEISNPLNPHKAQWNSCSKALERAELHFDKDYSTAAEILKTIALVNIFTKAGGKFDKKFIERYFAITQEKDVAEVLQTLEKAGIIRFYRHSNKINFLEGTDIDIEQELISASKEIDPNFSLNDEILSLIELPVILAKEYSYKTGTPRFFEYKIINSLSDVRQSTGVIDGYINLIFDNLSKEDIFSLENRFQDNIFVFYNNAKEIRESVFTIKKYDYLLEKHLLDANAVKLLHEEREFQLQLLKTQILDSLFESDQNIWIYNGKIHTVNTRRRLNSWLSNICSEIYKSTPIFVNELINKEFVSTPISTARKSLIRALLQYRDELDLNFPANKFPPEKAIYYSLLKETGIHKRKLNSSEYELSQPEKESEFRILWDKSCDFMKSAVSSRRKISEHYIELSKAPFKLKKGVIDFWIPIFLIAKQDEFALFHSEGGYIPFFNEETIDLIHRKPEDFYIKSYEVSKSKLNLLRNYFEITGLNMDESIGLQSILLKIYTQFLTFYRSLNTYSLNTDKLSRKTIEFREAIKNAQDPEDALFTQIPLAIIGKSNIDNEKDLRDFTKELFNSIEELKSVYNNFQNRIEASLQRAFYCDSTEFPKYKEEIINKLEDIESDTLNHEHKVFYNRLTSPLDDKESWLKSVADVVSINRIEELRDDEEINLHQNLRSFASGLINAAKIQSFNKASKNENKYVFKFYNARGEEENKDLILSQSVLNKYEKIIRSLEDELSVVDESAKEQILFELFKKYLNRSQEKYTSDFKILN